MELLVCCVFAYWLVKHLPEVASEVAQGIGYGLRGEESPTAAARRQRLADAGIDPASGGAFSQFAGNMWRDFWLDQDQARAGRRAGSQASADRSWWQSQQDRFDDLVDQYVRKLQTRTGDTPPGTSDEVPPATGAGGSDEPTVVHDDTPDSEPAAPAGDDTVREPIRVDATLGDPTEPDPRGPVPALGAPQRSTDTDQPQPEPSVPPTIPGPASPDRPLIRIAADLGEPTPNRTATAVLEHDQGETMSATVATRGIPVTGVQSGAAECLSINRELETAVAEFQARLANIAARVHSMGDQTLGIVQFAGASTVVTRMAQAAEAVAATKAQAIALGTEVSPLLMQTRAEFLRRA